MRRINERVTDQVLKYRYLIQQVIKSCHAYWQKSFVILIWSVLCRSGQIDAKELQRALVNGNWSNFSEEACRIMIGQLL